MKKLKLKRPRAIHALKKRVSKKTQAKEEATQLREALESLPRITNETVTEHREEIISKARKYIYPLEHSKHRVVLVSTSLLCAAIIIFFVYTGLALYRFQSYSTFLYDVTQVIPFPIAKAGSDYVAYENYLFELRHYIHYYQTQQKIDFSTVAGQQQLDSFKKQALQQVIDNAYIKQLSAKYNVSVSDADVNNEVNLLRQQNLIGNNNQVFADVLNQYWGWSISDFKRELKQQLLAQKLVSTLDTSTHQRAQAVLTELQGGADFATVAQQSSDDTTTKGNGGQLGFLVSKNNQDLAPQTVNQLFNMQPGQLSGIINIGTGLEIVKVLSVQNGQIQAAHILFNFQPISTYLNPIKNQENPHTYVSVN
jgi:parvulin-like peptidyl-prolyl isomerase